MLQSEVSPSQQDQHHEVPLTRGPRRSQIHRDGGDGRGGELVFHGAGAPVRADEKVLEVDGGDG